jgi:predicted AlkP superfamily phosphohydrolase/phosphomutase
MVIGLDGAEPSLTQQWMDEGYLPNLAALRKKGSFLPLDSTRPPVTFPAWTTCVTGVNPGRHGIFDFTEHIPGQYAIRFVNATYRKAPALWNILSQAQKKVGVLSVPGTYPPEEVNGFMVSGFDSPVATAVDASFVYPKTLYPEVKDWRFADMQEHNIGPGWHESALKALLNKIEDKERIACKLLHQGPLDFFMVVFGESDTVSHHFWMFHDPDSPRFRPGFENAIRHVYSRLDTAVGRLIAAAGEDVTIAIVSDHGFGGAGTGVVHLNNWLAQEGYLKFLPKRESIMKRAALTLVPTGMRGSLFRRFQGLATRAESFSRFGGIDWNQTTAWSEELNYFPSIRVNLRGREPSGQVNPEDYTAFVQKLCEQLNNWEHIRQASPRTTVFDGPHMNRAPDIILELGLEQGYSHSCLRSRGGPSFRRIQPNEFLGGKERGMNGNHRDTGILILSEPTRATSATLQDIAPTVLARLGVAGPAMDGHALLGESMLRHEDETGTDTQETPYSPEEQAQIEERLRALGYFE